MLFGITGSHRSGKTTLARAVSEELGIEFYETSTTKVAREFGYKATGDLTLTQRLHLQSLLLQNHLEELDKRARPLITDRTPLDFMGYLACEFTMANGNDQQAEVLQMAADFAVKCLDATRTYYDYVFYTSPLPEYVVEDGKPAANPIFQFHHAMVVLGGLTQLRDTINSSMIFETDWEVRRQHVHDTIVHRMDEIDTARQSARYLC